MCRNTDLSMLVLFNSNERTARAFETLFQQADSRYHVVNVKKPKGNTMAIIEVVWKSGK